VIVILSSDLTEGDAARTQAHEGNGHALFFIQDKDPNHFENETRRRQQGTGGSDFQKCERS